MTEKEKEEARRNKEYNDFRGHVDPPKKGSVREAESNIDKQYIDWWKNDRGNLAYNDDTRTTPVYGEWEDFGNSSHDPYEITNPIQGQGELNEIRANDQGFWEKIGLGAAKMTTTAATTFLDNTVGFIWGGVSAVVNQNASRIYDNDFTNAMQDFNEWCEEKMPHYSSKYEAWGLDFWGNFIGKDILQNIGFQIGTGLSMIVPGFGETAMSKAGISLTKNLAKFTAKKTAKTMSTAFKDVITSTYAAIGESSIEALQNKRDFVKYQNQLNEDSFNQQNEMLDRQWASIVMNKYNGDERMAVRSQEYRDYVAMKNNLIAQKRNKDMFIQQEAEKVGDMTFMANMAIVGASNYITFGKAVAGGMGLFKRSNTVTDIIDRDTKEVLRKNVSKSTAKDVIKNGKYAIRDKSTGEKVLRNAIIQERGLTKSPLINTIKDAVSEGLEEMNQSIASEWFSGAAEQDMLNYDALIRNGMAYDEVLRNINQSWVNYGNMAKAFNKVYTDPSQWRQFFSGMIGVGFSPHFQKGADGRLHFKLNNIGEQNAEINAYNSANKIIAENINNILNSEESQNYIKGLVRHSALDDAKRTAVALDSKIDYQDADFAQYVSDIAMLSDAGKLDLLRAQLESVKSMTDEELEDYCTKLVTDANGKKVGEFVDDNGNYIGTSDQARMDIRKKINGRVDQLLRDMETYQKAINEVDDKTGGVLTKENLATYAWEKANLQNKFNRAKSILGSDASARNLSSAKDKLGLMLKTNTDQLKSVKSSLDKEIQRVADANKKAESAGTAKIDKSELQKELEEDIETLTQNINVATEVSQLIADLEMMQMQSSDSVPMAELKKLFTKYADFRDSMPEVAKIYELNDEKTMSLESLMYSGQLNRFLGWATNSTIDDADMDSDYQDCAKLYRRGLDIEKSLDNMIKNPERYATERAEMEQKILERENADTIKAIEDEIKKAIDDGSMNFGNIEERTNEIIDNLKSAKNEKNVGRRLFRNAVNMLRDTPFDSLRKIALKNVLNSKKYQYLRDFSKFVNYVNVRIAMSKASPEAMMIAQKTFTEFIKDKNNVEECLSTKIYPEDIDVSELYKDNYTPETYANAQIVEGEVYQLLNGIFKDFAMDYYSPKLNIDKYDISNIKKSSDSVNRNEKDKQQAEWLKEKKAKVEADLKRYVNEFKGELLSVDDRNKMFQHIDSTIENEFNADNYDNEETKNDVEATKLNMKIFMHKYLANNIKERITKFYEVKSEAKTEEGKKSNKKKLKEAKEQIDKQLKNTKKENSYANETNVFSASAFDKLSQDDGSMEIRGSKEGYYVSNGNVMRGNLTPCNVTFNGADQAESHYAVITSTPTGKRITIVDKHGEIIGTKDVGDFQKKSKGNLNIKGVNRVSSSTNLQTIAQLDFLEKQNYVTNDKEQRMQEAREQASAEVLQENGTVDENGKVDVSQNLHNSTVTVNALMDDNITQSKKDIEDIRESAKLPEYHRFDNEYMVIYDYENDEIYKAKLPATGNRIIVRTINGKEQQIKFSDKELYDKGFGGILASNFGDTVDILFSSEEEWTGKKAEPKTQKKEETKPVVEKKEEKKEEPKQAETKGETPIQKQPAKPVETPKQKAKKEAKQKAKNTASELSKQLAKLEQMEKDLEEAVKNNPNSDYADTLHSVRTFKNYVQLVRDNYEEMGRPEKIVIDANAIWSINHKLTENLKAIFGNDNVLVLSDEEIENDLNQRNEQAVQFYLGKKARAEYQKILKKTRPDMSEEEMNAVLDFLHSLEDNKENTAFIKTAIIWVSNRSITLPADYEKVRQIFDVARKKNVDIQKYKTFGELMTDPKLQKQENEKPKFDPDNDAKTFSNKEIRTTPGGRTFVVYDVENTEEGQRDVCKALFANYESSPWCLSTFTKTGEPTQSSKRYWENYSDIPRKIAFENGKPVAFSSNSPQNAVDRVEPISGEVASFHIDIENNVQFPYFSFGNLYQKQIDKYINDGLVRKTEINDDLSLNWDDKIEVYALTDKGIEHFTPAKMEEAWWDMEDREPQPTLSDSIVSDQKSFLEDNDNNPAREELRENIEEVNEMLRRLGMEEIAFSRRSQKVGWNEDLGYANDSITFQEAYTIRQYIRTLDNNDNTEKGLWYKNNGNLYWFNTIIHSVKEGDYSHHGFQLLEKFDLNNLSKEDIKIINENADARTKESINSLLNEQGNWTRKRADYGDNVDSIDREPSRNNDSLDRETSEGKSINREIDRNSKENSEDDFIKTGFDGTNGPRYMKKSDLKFSKQNGEVFGYTADGKIVLNKDRIRLDTPVHEYTHLWDQAVQRINPEFWNQGKELMKQSAEWQKVINDKAYESIKDNEDLVASEVHSRLAGYIAAGKSVELYAKDRTKDKRNWFKKLIDWFMKFKDFTLKNIFNMSKADCKEIKLEQFLNAPVADFFMQTDPTKIGQAEVVVQEEAKPVEKPAPAEQVSEEQTIEEPVSEPEATTDTTDVYPIADTIENKTNELDEQIPALPLNVENQEEREVFATIDAINEHNDPPVPLDTYRPAISRFPIGKNNDTRPSYVVLGNGFEYIWNMYNALGAWDYVSQGKLSKDDDVYIGYGKVGENGKTVYEDVVFFVKDGDEYQMIGTLVNKNAPESANKLRNDIKRRYESGKQDMEKITVMAQKASGQFQSGKEFEFHLVKNGDKFLTTKPSKILNGRMQFTDTEYRSLKDVETPDGSKDFNIGFFTPDGLRDNMTTTDENKAKQFRSASSERSGHCVLILNKPDGDYQLMPLRLAKFSEINKPNNQVANDFRSIVSDLFDIYKSDKSAVMKNHEIVDSIANGGIIARMSNLVHTGEFSLFYNTNNTITVSVNGKKYKNQRFDSVEKMQDFFEDIMKDCLICVNKNTLNNPETLSKYIDSDVFSTNLKTTEFANPFYTLMPIDSNGKELEVVNDIQDDNYLEENDITTVLSKFGDRTYAVVDKFGNVKIGVKQFDEFNTSEANRLYSPEQRMRMISYALLKNGMQSNPNDSLFDDYHIDDDENETTLLAHKTMYGDTIFYEVENFTEISPDRVSYYDGEGNLIKLSKPEETETVDNDDSDAETYEDDDYYDYLEVDLDNEDDDISEESIEVDNESEDKFQEDVNTLMNKVLAKGFWKAFETLKEEFENSPMLFVLTLDNNLNEPNVRKDLRMYGNDEIVDTIENFMERYRENAITDYLRLFMDSNSNNFEDGFKLVSEEAVRKILKNNLLNKEDDPSKLANKKNDECTF